MKKLLTAFVPAVVVLSVIKAPPALSQEDGKAIFLKNKCISCHAIVAQGISKKADEEEKIDKDKEVPDLSGVGLERSADWMSKYLQKKESIKGEKHSKKFKGSDEELAVLTKWLETLKTERKKSGK